MVIRRRKFPQMVRVARMKSMIVKERKKEEVFSTTDI